MSRQGCYDSMLPYERKEKEMDGSQAKESKRALPQAGERGAPSIILVVSENTPQAWWSFSTQFVSSRGVKNSKAVRFGWGPPPLFSRSVGGPSPFFPIETSKRHVRIRSRFV